MKINSRQKGHRFERLMAQLFRELGFKHCKTSREKSRVLDACGVDLTDLPWNIQLKSGYINNRPKYEQLYEYIKEKLKENYDKHDPIHKKPVVLIWKKDGRKKQNIQWVWNHEDMVALLTDYLELKRKVDGV